MPACFPFFFSPSRANSQPQPTSQPRPPTHAQTTALATTTQRILLLLLLCAPFWPAVSAFISPQQQKPIPVTTCPFSMAASTSSGGDAALPPPDKRIVTKVYRRTLPPGISLNKAYDEWLQYTWIDGGGLSVGKPPIIRERGDLVTGQGLLREIPPIGIQEKILAAERPSAVTYRVVNPGWTTYQVHWHKGSVKWTKGATDAEGIVVEWSISVVPWFGFGWWVSLMVRAGLMME